MADGNVTTKTLYGELNDLRKEINDKLDNISEQIRCVSDSRVSHQEMELYLEPLKQKIALMERILWGVGAAAGFALINALLNLVIK